MRNLSRRGRRLAAGLVCGLVGVGCFAAEVAGSAAVPYVTGAVFGAPLKVEGAGDRAMALALEGDVLYAGCGPQLVVFDVKAPLAPRRLGAVGGFGEIRQIAAEKGMAYVATRESGLWIVDASDPARPRVRSRFDCCELATGVDVAGDVVFLGQRQNGVEFIDVSDPDRPAHIAMRKTDESQSVKYRDGYLYSGDWGSGRLTVFDVRDLRKIRQVAYVPLWGYGDGVWLKGRYLYAATGHHAKNRDFATLPFKPVDTPEIRKFGKLDAGSGCGHGLDVFDISDPASPKRVGRADFPPFYARGLDMWTPRTSANAGVVFVAQTHNGLFAVDCADPARPKILDRWVFPLADHPEWPSCCIGSVAVGNGCVYVAGLGCGVQVLPAKCAAQETFRAGPPPRHADFREPYPTDGAAFHVWRPAKPGQARAVALRGDVVYAACGDAGLHVLRIRPEGGFERLGGLPERVRVFDVQVEGSRLYTAEGLDGWGVYELDGPTGFREVARRAHLDAVRDPALWVYKPCPGFIALSTRRNGASLFADTDLQAARPLVRVGGCPGWDRYLMDAPVGKGRWLAYNAANTALRWIDLASAPKVKVVSTDNNRISLCNGICRFSDDLAFATSGTGYLFLKPGECDPADGSKWKVQPFPGMAMAGIPRVSPRKRVVLTERIRRRIGLWDFADPDLPKFLGCWTVSGNPGIAEFYRERIVVPCGYQGVLLQK